MCVASAASTGFAAGSRRTTGTASYQMSSTHSGWSMNGLRLPWYVS